MKTVTIAVLSIAFYLLLTGCNHSTSSNGLAVTSVKDSVIAVKENPDWADSVVYDYIKRSNNEMIHMAYIDTVPVKWMTEYQTREGVNYIAVRIGHDMDFHFATAGWLFIDSITAKLYEYDIANDSLIPWQSVVQHPIEVGVAHGNLFVMYNVDQQQTLTQKGIDTMPVLSPDGEYIIFLRYNAGTKDTDYDICSATRSIWLYNLATQKEEQLVTPQYTGSSEKTLGSFDNLTFSPDSRYVYFNSCAWAVSSSINRYDIANHTEKFISDGNGFTIIASGKYKGYLITSKHKYYNGGGSYDDNWLITPDGKEVKDIGAEETVQ